MIGGGPIMEDEGNLTVQNLSGRQPFRACASSRLGKIGRIFIGYVGSVSHKPGP